MDWMSWLERSPRTSRLQGQYTEWLSREETQEYKERREIFDMLRRAAASIERIANALEARNENPRP